MKSLIEFVDDEEGAGGDSNHDRMASVLKSRGWRQIASRQMRTNNESLWNHHTDHPYHYISVGDRGWSHTHDDYTRPNADAGTRFTPTDKGSGKNKWDLSGHLSGMSVNESTDDHIVFHKDMPHVPDMGFSSYHAPEDWAHVEGQNHNINEPPLPVTHKKISTGVIMREPDGKVWMTKPTNGYGGYDHSFPKGGLEKGLHPQANAIKEAHEETGLKARITGHAGDYEGDTSVTRYYHAVREGGHPLEHGWESEAVVLAPGHRAHEFLNRRRDQQIAHDHLGAPEPTASS